jgi:hypothetical protein
MATEYVPVGRVRDVNGWVTEVQRDPGGLITIFSGQETKWDAARLAEYRELLDRAAMPGQPAADADERYAELQAENDAAADLSPRERGRRDAREDVRRMWNDAFGHDPY